MSRSKPILLSAVALWLAGAASQEKREPSRVPASPRTEFVVQSELGDESAWTKPYLEGAARVLTTLMNNPEVAPPEKVVVSLKNDPKSKGIRGKASATSLSYTSNVWPKEGTRLWILAHELANLSAAHYAGGGGFPSDWWSNGRILTRRDRPMQLPTSPWPPRETSLPSFKSMGSAGNPTTGNNDIQQSHSRNTQSLRRKSRES